MYKFTFTIKKESRNNWVATVDQDDDIVVYSNSRKEVYEEIINRVITEYRYLDENSYTLIEYGRKSPIIKFMDKEEIQEYQRSMKKADKAVGIASFFIKFGIGLVFPPAAVVFALGGIPEKVGKGSNVIKTIAKETAIYYAGDGVAQLIKKGD